MLGLQTQTTTIGLFVKDCIFLKRQQQQQKQICFIILTYVYLCMVRPEEVFGSLDLQLDELPNMGAGNQILVLCKTSK